MKQLGGGAFPTNHASANTTGVVVTGVPGRQIRVLGGLITCDAGGGTFQFTDSESNDLSAVHSIAAGAVLPLQDLGWFADTEAGADLEVTITGNVALDINYSLI